MFSKSQRMNVKQLLLKKVGYRLQKNLTWQNPRILYYVLLQVNETNPTKSFPTEVSDGLKAIIAR